MSPPNAVEPSTPPPVFRRLRVFAVDPGTSVRSDAVPNERLAHVAWEPLAPGPVGEYVEVVDRDEHGRTLFAPVDLDSPDLLAQDGITPSDGNPWFRQQMLYAVSMTTIARFERALGRIAQWRPLPEPDSSGSAFRRRLTLFPHFDTDSRAFYDAGRGMCFGWFTAGEDTAAAGTVVFTCLSQDVVVHELTHALLDGMNVEFSSADRGALHEAFADLVALFGHFGDGEVLREQIRAVRGDLDRPSSLGAIGLQMGRATGRPDGMRNVLGRTREDGTWEPRRPDREAHRTASTPHERATVLESAVFEAFRAIYATRVADLLRIASGGTGVLPAGDLHPDLVARLSGAAAATARDVQLMCISALDLLPPVDATFGDFLRALLTADQDLDPADPARRRVAFVTAFRGYGLVPDDVATLSADTLAWPAASDRQQVAVVRTFVRDLALKTSFWTLPTDRRRLWDLRESWKVALTEYLEDATGRIGPIDLARPLTVTSCDLRRRTGVAGALDLDWVIKIVQFDAGVTLLVDATTGRIRHLVAKPSPRRGRTLLDRVSRPDAPRPTQRMLRVFAFDPELGTELATAGINEVTLAVPWERDARGASALAPGPSGEYLEVIDHDPASGCFYAPVDLDEPAVVAQQGLTPSESSPQFHQQMVYAVAMRIIRDFETALGRRVLWSPLNPSTPREEYVGQLRIHPHALREANAYYSPARKALLFGYFPASAGVDGTGGPQLTVFTCLSHDIVAHEVTHAILDGVHQRFDHPTNPDVLAFHEAFADIVALFEHFSLPDVLVQQIAETRGDLASQNRLGELARQFGRALGRRGALRSAIGSADPARYATATEPHERGAVLVAAVFDAFLTIYKNRVADLLRIASEGTGVLPAGSLHPDLVRRLADEAATAARRVLLMCVRALDYCPPVDLTFGDYLRALITADVENDPVDETHDRVAFVEAFRRHGIVPDDVRGLSVGGLQWQETSTERGHTSELVLVQVREWARDIPSWHLTGDRHELFRLMRAHRAALHGYLEETMRFNGRVLDDIDPERPFEVHSIRPSTGTDWYGRPRFHWIIEVIQTEDAHLDPDAPVDAEPDARLLGGVTLVVDGRSGRVRYMIHKPLDEARRTRQLARLRERSGAGLAATFSLGRADEPFALLHRG